jgi:NADH:ubiquinone oxidoreductase subunit C
METDALLEKGSTILKPWIIATHTPETTRLDVQIAPENLLNAISALFTEKWGYLSTITGLDNPAKPAATGEKVENAATQPENIELLYHFCSGPAILTLRVPLDRSHPVVKSVCSIYPSATLAERELMEMFGIVIEDTPNKDRLLISDDWPSGVFPLRKDFHPEELPDKAEEK